MGHLRIRYLASPLFANIPGHADTSDTPDTGGHIWARDLYLL